MLMGRFNGLTRAPSLTTSSAADFPDSHDSTVSEAPVLSGPNGAPVPTATLDSCHFHEGDSKVLVSIRHHETPVSSIGLRIGLMEMSHRLARFFRSPALSKDDYADLFLLYLGEDIGARIPQEKIRGYQNIFVRPCDVIFHCLRDLYEIIRRRRPGFTENDLVAYINWFLTHEAGCISRQIAAVARGNPYLGKVIPENFPDFLEPDRARHCEYTDVNPDLQGYLNLNPEGVRGKTSLGARARSLDRPRLPPITWRVWVSWLAGLLVGLAIGHLMLKDGLYGGPRSREFDAGLCPNQLVSGPSGTPDDDGVISDMWVSDEAALCAADSSDSTDLDHSALQTGAN